MTPAWKKVGVACLIGCAVVLLLIVVAGRPPRTPPATVETPPWNSQAIEGSLAGIRVQEIDPTHAAVVFLYDIDNSTDTDYRLAKGPNIVIMSRLKSGGTLSADEPIELDSTAFVPARNRTRIALEVSHIFSWPGQNTAYAERAFNQLVAGDVAGVAGFVLFDQTNRYEIDFPAAWPAAQPSAVAP
ncbi:MAG TPA: hypothetical protein VMD77_06090 [Candidatus Baltobacteraceae bacterium]|nr:hypothetical protein [Candidatus Baltobacteraceae bacterium]